METMLETPENQTTNFAADEVYARTLPLTKKLSVLTPGDSEYRTEFYEKMGVCHTPTQEAATLLRNLATPGADLLLVKPELDQLVGSYKIRGAAAAVAACLRHNPDLQNIHTASAGNHAQGVGQAARAAGISNIVTHTFEGIAEPKERALLAQGITVQKYPSLELAIHAAKAADNNADSAYIPPFDSYDVMAGQSTIAAEIFADLLERQQNGKLDLHNDEIHLIVPGGGGGCASGTAIQVRQLKEQGVVGEQVRVWIAQGQGADAINQERNGRQLATANPRYDGAFVIKPGKRNMAVLHDDRFVEGTIVVSEAETGNAMHWLSRHHKRAVESTGALSLAGAMRLAPVLPPKQDGVRRVFITVTSGGNVAPETTRYFMDVASAHNRAAFSQLSQTYLTRQTYGLEELCQRDDSDQVVACSLGAASLRSGTRIIGGLQLR